MSAVPIVDCWNSIGIYGDGTCPELEHHIHCRNCPLYLAAARRLLESDAPASYREEWTCRVAKAAARPQRDAHSVLIFRVGAEWLAVSAGVMSEIASMRCIHSLPHRRDGAVLGIANIRGELLVCISLQQILSIDLPLGAPREENYPVAARFLVMQHEGSRLVCPVDEVHGIQRYGDQDLAAVPPSVGRAAGRHTKGLLRWQTHRIGLLDDELLFRSMNRTLT